MPWKPKQVRLAAIAARHAGWNDQQRRMVLSSLGGRVVHGGRLTSRSPRLNQDDFEQYMATAEAAAGGVLPGWRMGYWHDKARSVIQKQRHRIMELADRDRRMIRDTLGEAALRLIQDPGLPTRPPQAGNLSRLTDDQLRRCLAACGVGLSSAMHDLSIIMAQATRIMEEISTRWQPERKPNRRSI